MNMATPIYFEEYGNPENDTIIFLHCAGIVEIYNNFGLEQLSEQYHVLLPHLYGSGREVGRDFSFEETKEALIYLAETQNKSKVYLVKHSEGANLALALLQSKPGLFKKVIVSSLMIEAKDSAKQLFDVVIVWKLDRFARNRYDSAQHKNTLKKNGVKVVSATEQIADDSTGILIESILEGYAEYYSAKLSEKVKRGNPININFLTRLLNNRRYMGEYSHGGIVQEDAIPVIVPKDLFSRVQKRMVKNKKAPAHHKAGDNYLLTTKLYCGCCKAFMVGESGTNRTKKHTTTTSV